MNNDSSLLVSTDKDHLWHHITQHKVFENQDPMVVTEAHGLVIKDQNGREFLDAVSGGVWCVNVGYGQDRIADAVCAQLKKMPYYALTAGNAPAIELADKLTTLLPGLQKVFFANSGSEANEKAFKMSRQYFRLKYEAKDKYKIIYRYRDYHGTTIAALSATGQPERKLGYGPLVPGFVEMPHACCYRCAFGKTYPGCDIDCARSLEKVIKAEREDTVAAVIFEPITAGGGVLVPVDEYYGIIQEICKKYEVLLIFDEVVNGFGRTGTMFGHQHWNVEPDMVTLAKGMASSYAAISALMTKREIFDQFLNEPSNALGYFRDISTYGGCTGGTAAAIENIKIMEEQNMCDYSAKMGRYFIDSLKELEDLPVVGEVRGRGLFAGIELVEDKTTKLAFNDNLMNKVVGMIKEDGVLVGRTSRSFPNQNNTLAFAPAFTVTKGQLDTIVAAVKKTLETF